MFVSTRIIFSYFQRESLSPVESAGLKKKEAAIFINGSLFT